MTDGSHSTPYNTLAQTHIFSSTLLTFSLTAVNDCLTVPLETCRELLAEALDNLEYPVIFSQTFNAKPADLNGPGITKCPFDNLPETAHDVGANPVEEFVHLYNILLMLFDDEQAGIEKFIFKREAGVQWKHRPEIKRPKRRKPLKREPVTKEKPDGVARVLWCAPVSNSPVLENRRAGMLRDRRKRLAIKPASPLIQDNLRALR